MFNTEFEYLTEKLGKEPEQKFYFYGSKLNTPESIYDSEEGFDTRYSDEYHSLYGSAIYFSKDAKFSDQYAYST